METDNRTEPCIQHGGADAPPVTETRVPYETMRRPGSNFADQETAAAASDRSRLETGRVRISGEQSSPAIFGEASEESLWSLLHGRGLTICIPALQRDYIHGRTDRETGLVRRHLVKELMQSLCAAARSDGDMQRLDLGFVCGNLEEERFLVPVDGHQRLTALLLLHWLLAHESGRLSGDPVVRDCLLRFRYEGRESVMHFWERLVMEPPCDLCLPCGEEEKNLSGAICCCSWFTEDLEGDGTVRSMLVMLDALQEGLNAVTREGIPAQRLFLLLTSECRPVYFLFLNLDDAGLSDSTYIRMNARGRPLTYFESFKARLRPFLDEDENAAGKPEKSFSDEFLNGINGRWAALFWRPEYRPRGSCPTTDLPMLRFFRFLIETDFIVNSEPEKGPGEADRALSLLLQESDETFFSRLFRDGFCEVGRFRSGNPPVNRETFRKISRLLDLLEARKREAGTVGFMRQGTRRRVPLDEEGCFRRLIGAGGETALNGVEMILLYAEYAFLLRYARPDSSFRYTDSLTRWLRLVSCLTDAAQSLEEISLFGAIRSVNRLVESGFALRCTKAMLRWPRVPQALSVFPSRQISEEAVKAALKLSGVRWRKAVRDAEDSFLGGRIDMLFDFAGITAGEIFRQGAAQEVTAAAQNGVIWTAGMAGCGDVTGLQIPPVGAQEYEKFLRYMRRFRLLFDRDGVRPELEKDALLRRALLCYGGADSYLLPPGRARQCFLDSTDRDMGFRRLLRDSNEGRRLVVKQLLDDLDETRPAAPQLREIIARKVFTGEERWKEYFVTMPEILCSVLSSGADSADPMGEWVFRNEQRYIRRRSQDDILLLSRTHTSSVSREYYSYVLFLKARKQGLPVSYHADYTESSEKYAWFENREGERIRVLYRNPDASGWRFLARREGEDERRCEGSQEEMLRYIRDTINRENGTY